MQIHQDKPNKTLWKSGALCLALIALTSLALAGCADSSKNDATTEKPQGQTAQYTCSMHPEVVQSKPGDCPKCGMKLVEKK